MICCQLTQETIHRQMKSWIIIFDSIKQFSNIYPCIQFLVYLPDQSVLWSFTSFYFSSREFPSPFKFSVSSLGCKYLLLVVFFSYNYCSNYQLFPLSYSNCHHTILFLIHPLIELWKNIHIIYFAIFQINLFITFIFSIGSFSIFLLNMISS